jgi:hypothetical protein
LRPKSPHLQHNQEFTSHVRNHSCFGAIDLGGDSQWMLEKKLKNTSQKIATSIFQTNKKQVAQKNFLAKLNLKSNWSCTLLEVFG